MTMRSALPKENGQLTMGCVVTRLVTLPRRPRARNTDNRVPSATETRAIEALAPSRAGVLGPRGEEQREGGGGAQPTNPLKFLGRGAAKNPRGPPRRKWGPPGGGGSARRPPPAVTPWGCRGTAPAEIG